MHHLQIHRCVETLPRASAQQLTLFSRIRCVRRSRRIYLPVGNEAAGAEEEGNRHVAHTFWYRHPAVGRHWHCRDDVHAGHLQGDNDFVEEGLVPVVVVVVAAACRIPLVDFALWRKWDMAGSWESDWIVE